MKNSNIIVSSLSRNFLIDGQTFKFEIYSLENEAGWTLEVIDDEGASTVWDIEFETDLAAHEHLMTVLDTEGITAFRAENIIPFRKL